MASWTLWVVLASLSLAACGQAASTDDRSQTLDIFRQDEDGQRRRRAQGDELNWTINMRGCTGHLISPEYMMTASHCRPLAGARYTSGASLASGAGPDISVERVVEQDARLDYAIMKIRWSGAPNPAQKFPPLIAAKASDVVISTQPQQGDAIFTVGFPGDGNGQPIYSEGQLKEVRQHLLVYDMGIINGNSGGGAWRKSDKMLVSLTNAGPNKLGQGSWRGNDVNDPRHWNWGVAMWVVYERSQVLQEVFPGGKNKFATDNAPPTPPPTPGSETPPADASAGGSAGKTGLIEETFIASNGARSTYRANVPADVATKVYGLHIHFHGDGGGGYRDFPNKELRHDLIGVTVKAPNQSLTWGRQEGVAHALFAQELIQNELSRKYKIDKSKIYFSGVSGGAYFLSGSFLPAYGHNYNTGALLLCGGEAPRGQFAQADFLTQFKLRWVVTQDERQDINASMRRAIDAYKQALSQQGAGAVNAPELQAVETMGNGGGHCAFDSRDYTSGIQLAIDQQFQRILK